MQSAGTILPSIAANIHAVTPSRNDFVIRMLPSPVSPSLRDPNHPVPPQQKRTRAALT